MSALTSLLYANLRSVPLAPGTARGEDILNYVQKSNNQQSTGLLVPYAAFERGYPSTCPLSKLSGKTWQVRVSELDRALVNLRYVQTLCARLRRSAPAQTTVFHPVCKLYLGCPEGHAANRIFQDARPSGALLFLFLLGKQKK